MKNGIKELFFTSDGLVNEFANKTGFEVAPFYDGMSLCTLKKTKSPNWRKIHQLNLLYLFLYFLNPKFQASSLFLRLFRPVCVGPAQK